MKIVVGIILAVFLFTVSPAEAIEPWTKTDTVFQAVTVALIVADWGQTRWMQRQYVASEVAHWRGPDGSIHLEGWKQERYFDEINPILGEHPSQAKIDTYFVGMILGHTAIARLLPQPYRRFWQGVFIFTEAGLVTHNITIGAKIKF